MRKMKAESVARLVGMATKLASKGHKAAPAHADIQRFGDGSAGPKHNFPQDVPLREALVCPRRIA
jgi:hypothetical protein